MCSAVLLTGVSFALDRTWQDGLVVSQRWKYTNVLVRLKFMFDRLFIGAEAFRAAETGEIHQPCRYAFVSASSLGSVYADVYCGCIMVQQLATYASNRVLPVWCWK